MIGLACLIGAILSALVLGLAVIVLDLRDVVRSLGLRIDAGHYALAKDVSALRESLPKKRIRRKAVVAS